MPLQANHNPVTLKELLKVLVASAVLIFITQLLLVKFDFLAYTKQFKHQSVVTSLMYLLQSAEMLAPLYWFVVRKHKLRFADFGFTKVPVKKIITSVLESFGIVMIFNIVLMYFILELGIEIPGFGMQQEHISLFGTATIDIVLAVVVVALLAPVIEELFFRGFLLKTLLKYMHPALASLIVASIFGLIHLEFSSAGILIFLGLILNRLYIKTGSLLPGIAFHLLNNILAFWMEFQR